MNTPILIITAVTLVVILGSLYLEIRRQIKPRIKVYFPDGSTQASYKAKENATVALHMKNSGRFGLPKPVATELSILVYTPTNLLLKKWSCIDGMDNRLRKAPLGGIFGGMHYMGGETRLSLFDKEEELMTILLQMPEGKGKYPVKVAITSKEGDLGIHKLTIIVT